MSMGTDTTWVGKKPLRRIGGMSDALSIAADLGFAVASPPSQEELQNLSTATGEKGDNLIKDRIIARLQQPYSLDCIPVEAEYQKQFSELLMKAASDYGALTASVADFQWSQNFKESPSAWGYAYGNIEMLRPIPVALASCTRFFEAMSAMRESFATLQNLRVGHSVSSLPKTPANDPSHRLPGDSDCVTPPWRNESSFDDLSINSLKKQEVELQEADNESSEVGDFSQVDGTSHRRLSWPPSVKKSGI
ncbi:hypothetical protein GH714_031942 [Hevea brasiliensis]|uniref:AUGMIN subunit 2 n=1 Tax=Hevea brasiliensis TaxID=3981 RepID=A0A6A6K815_HEVBR|nr:hypothetical protein GH714_031942 [Hevea brasiliensis]